MSLDIQNWSGSCARRIGTYGHLVISPMHNGFLPERWDSALVRRQRRRSYNREHHVWSSLKLRTWTTTVEHCVRYRVPLTAAQCYYYNCVCGRHAYRVKKGHVGGGAGPSERGPGDGCPLHSEFGATIV